jgi:lysine biosynthesis protein LysW
MNAQCPECDAWVQVPRAAEIWDTLVCPKCHTELQLISVNPHELDYADFEEDYDDFDDDDLDDDDDFDDDDF